MRGTKESCYLVERMAKVEVRQNIIMMLMVAIICFLGFITLKLMNTQIYLLTGEKGLSTISTVSHNDAKTLNSTQSITQGVVK